MISISIHYTFSPERNQFWKDGKYGYTSAANEFHDFTYSQAHSICKDPNTKDFPVQGPIPFEPSIPFFFYIHANGAIHFKRFFSEKDFTGAKESDFVKDAFGPFNT